MGDFNFAPSVVKMQRSARISRLARVKRAGRVSRKQQIHLILPLNAEAIRRVVSGACIQEVNERKYNRDVETEPAGKSFYVP
jgi:hypothetical protein